MEPPVVSNSQGVSSIPFTLHNYQDSTFTVEKRDPMTDTTSRRKKYMNAARNSQYGSTNTVEDATATTYCTDDATYDTPLEKATEPNPSDADTTNNPEVMEVTTAMVATPDAIGDKKVQPNNSKRSRLMRRLNRMSELEIMIILMAAIFLPPVLVFAVTGTPPVQVTEITTNTITLKYSGLNQGLAEEKIKPWVPTALGIDTSAVSKVLITSVNDGTTGTVILTNGETVPFTLHNYDRTFTVTKD